MNAGTSRNADRIVVIDGGVVAETGGTVQELKVNEGDVVQEGDVIAVIG